MKRKSRRINIKLDRDKTILIICIGIASFFWLLLKLSYTYQTNKTVTISAVNIPDDKALSALPPNDMEAKLEGDGWNLMLESISGTEVNVVYNLDGLDALQRNYNQLKRDIEKQLSSRNIQVVDVVNYDRLNFQLEPKKRKKIPILLNRNISFAQDFHMKDSLLLDPDSVEISGPELMVNSISSWETDSLLALNLKSNLEKKVKLQDGPPELQLGVGETSVFLEVEQYTEKSFFVPVLVKNPPDSFKIFPQNIKLSCKVGLSQYNDLDEKDFVAEVDARDIAIKEGKKTVPIYITTIPDFVRNVFFSPKSAELFIIESEELESK